MANFNNDLIYGLSVEDKVKSYLNLKGLKFRYIDSVEEQLTKKIDLELYLNDKTYGVEIKAQRFNNGIFYIDYNPEGCFLTSKYCDLLIKVIGDYMYIMTKQDVLKAC